MRRAAVLPDAWTYGSEGSQCARSSSSVQTGAPVHSWSWTDIYTSSHMPEVPVVLHVYSLGRSKLLSVANKTLRKLGTGVFHAGVAVHGSEWSFAGGGTGSGIVRGVPGDTSDHLRHKEVLVGVTTLKEGEVQSLLDEMSAEWASADYDVLSKNCLHFADKFLQRLGFAGAPRWLLNSTTLALNIQMHVPGAGRALRHLLEGGRRRKAAAALLDGRVASQGGA